MQSLALATPATDLEVPPRVCVRAEQASVYLSGSGMEERMSLVPLHDEANGVISSMHCFELHQEHLLPENAGPCRNLRSRYDDYTYSELMNTTFGLVPGGRSPGTYRLAEVRNWATASGGAGVIRAHVLQFLSRFAQRLGKNYFSPWTVQPFRYAHCAIFEDACKHAIGWRFWFKLLIESLCGAALVNSPLP